MPPRRDGVAPTAARAKRLQRLAAQVYGDGWERGLREEMMVEATTVWRWLNAKVPIPQSVFVALECKVREAKK